MVKMSIDKIKQGQIFFCSFSKKPDFYQVSKETWVVLILTISQNNKITCFSDKFDPDHIQILSYFKLKDYLEQFCFSCL